MSLAITNLEFITETQLVCIHTVELGDQYWMISLLAES